MSMASLKPLFPGLEFSEEEHKYTVDGVAMPSVSSLVKEFYEEFDFNGVSERYAKKRNFPLQVVRDAWRGENDEANRIGHMVHKFGEDYARHRYFGIGDMPVPPNRQSLGVVEYYNRLPEHIEVVDLELQMYSKKYGYCGTADKILFNHQRQFYIISDWKTNKELHGDPKWRKMALNLPLEYDIDQYNYSKYQIQLSLYQILMEEAGLKVGGRLVVWLKDTPTGEFHTIYNGKDLTVPLRSWLKNRAA